MTNSKSLPVKEQLERLVSIKLNLTNGRLGIGKIIPKYIERKKLIALGIIKTNGLSGHRAKYVWNQGEPTNIMARKILEVKGILFKNVTKPFKNTVKKSNKKAVYNKSKYIAKPVISNITVELKSGKDVVKFDNLTHNQFKMISSLVNNKTAGISGN